jgi:hypothetical protein
MEVAWNISIPFNTSCALIYVAIIIVVTIIIINIYFFSFYKEGLVN